MDLIIKQNINQLESGNSALLDLLYNLTKPDPSTGQAIIDNAILIGRISVPSGYEDAVNFLNTHFSVERDNGSDFQVSVLNNNYYIRFADSAVEEVLLNNGFGDGTGITTQEAADNSIGELLNNNQDITSFNEFKYFRKNNTNTTYKINNCPALVSIDLSECINYPGGTFQNLPNLEYFNGPNSEPGVLIFPEGTTTINYNGSFSSLPKLKHIIFPSTMRSFNANTFNSCANVETITLNPGFETFGGNSFSASGTGKLIISDLNAYFNITWAAPNSYKNFFRSCPYFFLKDSNGDLTEITTITVPQTVLTINGAIFCDCKSITEVVLHSGITSIGRYAFTNCSNLVIPDLNLPNLASLGSYAFCWGTKVQTISDLGSVTNIPESCFSGCSQLTTIDQGVLDKITDLNKEAFNNCTNFGSAKQSDNTISTVLRLPNLTSIAMNAVRYTKFTEIADLGSITTVMGFSEMTNLTSVVLPQTCTTVGNSAFVNDRALTTINLSNNITSIVTSAFNGCENLIYFHGAGSVAGELNLSNVTSIGNMAFQNCKKLTSLTIGNSATSIGSSAFNGCNGLTAVTIGNSVTSIGNFAFQNCTSLATINFPNSITSVGEGAFTNTAWFNNQPNGPVIISSHVLYGYKGTIVGSYVVPNGIVSIGDYGFYGQSGLTSVTMSESTTSIGVRAFANCNSLTSITANAVTPPTLSHPNAFDNTNNCPIYVPEGSVTAYKSASNWSTYAGRIQAIQE